MLVNNISNIPAKPGIYILKGQKDKVLYVGKAKNLRNRLKTYFTKSNDLDMRKSAMVRLITDFSYVITKNELEAFILEANLIKQYKPRFNVLLRDDKNYPYLKLTIGEKWPCLEIVRKMKKDKALYFGPYVPAQGMWEALAFIRRNFPIRLCKYMLDKPMRPCIQYQMGRCTAPCAEKISRQEYMKIVKEVKLFLEGKRTELLIDLEEKMMRLSNKLKFEEAARIRDRIKNIQSVWESQRVVAPGLGDIDVIGRYSDNVDVVFAVFFVRNGLLIGSKDFYLKDAGESPPEEVLRSFIQMFYAKEIIPPDEIIAGNKPDDLVNLKSWLKQKKGKRVEIWIPKEDKKIDLLKMADENAAQIFHIRKPAGAEDILKGIRDRFNLPYLPRNIGAFDISTISGSESVGGFIYWSDGAFKKDLYRRLRIKGVSGIDDYSMMSEAISRILTNLGDKVPDLIIVDGGKGQFKIAREVIDKGKFTRSDGIAPMLVAVAKDPDRALTLTSDFVDLEDGSPASLFLKKIRDEVHGFAVRYHRKLRDRRLMESPLEKIPGIGKKRRFELLRHFGSINGIRNATIDEIAKLKGFNKKISEKVLAGLGRM